MNIAAVPSASSRGLTAATRRVPRGGGQQGGGRGPGRPGAAGGAEPSVMLEPSREPGQTPNPSRRWRAGAGLRATAGVPAAPAPSPRGADLLALLGGGGPEEGPRELPNAAPSPHSRAPSSRSSSSQKTAC